jgi:hypothetical protein
MPTQQGWIRSLVFKTYVHKNLYVLNKGSYAARGKRKKLGLENQLAIKIIDDAPNRKICRKSWAQLIYQVYEVDPLKCPNPAKLRSPLHGGIRTLEKKRLDKKHV